MSTESGILSRAWRRFAEALTASLSGGAMATGALQLCAIFLPVLNIFSNAAIALFGFHHGTPARFVVPAGAALLTLAGAVILHWFGLIDEIFRSVVLPLCSYWLPLMLLTWVWRKTSMSMALQILSVGALVVLGAAYWFVDDLALAWKLFLSNSLPPQGLEEATPEMLNAIDSLMKNMTGMIIAGMIALWTFCALLGRWMHFLLKERGLFRAEVAEFHMGAVLTIVAAVAAVLWSLDGHPIWMDVVVVLVILFLVQGVITVHQMIVTLSDNPQPWLIGFYILLIVSAALNPFILSGVAVLGALENFINLKHRCRTLKERAP